MTGSGNQWQKANWGPDRKGLCCPLEIRRDSRVLGSLISWSQGADKVGKAGWKRKRRPGREINNLRRQTQRLKWNQQLPGQRSSLTQASAGKVFPSTRAPQRTRQFRILEMKPVHVYSEEKLSMWPWPKRLVKDRGHRVQFSNFLFFFFTPKLPFCRQTVSPVIVKNWRRAEHQPKEYNHKQYQPSWNRVSKRCFCKQESRYSHWKATTTQDDPGGSGLTENP